MKTNNQKNTFAPIIFLTMVLMLFSVNQLEAQFYYITGESSVIEGTQHEYTLDGGTPPQNISWIVPTGATLISSNGFQATVRWDFPGYYQVTANYTGNNSATLFVNVTGIPPADPGNPTITTNNCERAILTKVGNPPTGVTWFWQDTNNNGTNSNPNRNANSPYPAPANGTYYIRARKNNSGVWSDNSGSRSVTVIEFDAGDIAGTQDMCFTSNPGILSSINVATGGTSYSYQWQYSNNGTSGWTNISGATSPTYDPPSPLSASRWYRRAVTSCSGITKNSNSIKKSIITETDPGSINTPQPVCYGVNPANISNNTAPTGGTQPYSYVWQTSSDNSNWSNISNATSASYDPPSLTTSRWYRRGVSACEGLQYTPGVQLIVHPSVAVATGEDVAQCGSGSVTLTAAFEAGNANQIRWYTTPTGGGILETGTSLTRTITETTTYYAESYNSVTTCVALRRKTIQAIITNSITYYADFDNDGLGNPDDTLVDCTQPNNYVTNALDNCPDIQDPYNNCTVVNLLSTDPQKHNYVYTRAYQTIQSSAPAFFTPDDNNDLIQNITFFDGLGRPRQQTGINQTSSKADIVTHMDYDVYGRMFQEWLPYAEVDGALATFRPYAKTSTEGHYAVSTYDNTPNPYSEKTFEPSPLNRVLKKAAPGLDWQKNNGHEIEYDYLTNETGVIKLFRVDLSGGNESPTLSQNSFYASRELFKNITKDENHTGDAKNHTTEEFTDKQGRVVLKRTYGPFDVDKSGIIDTEESELPFDTYYVYDDYGNLTYVLPPKMEASTATLAAMNTNMAELGYQYIYDHRNRLVEKRIPGKEWEYIIYNKLDQPIMTQDANQRAKEANSDEWLFTKYDAFGRVAYTGKARAPEGTSREEVQSDVDSFADPLWVEPLASGGSFGATTRVFYNNGAYPNNDAEDPSLVALNELLTINYYDNYDFLDSEKGLGLPAKVFDKKIENHNNSEKIKTRGLATGSKVKVLTTNQWITTVTGYDAKGRAIFGLSKNPYLGTLDRSETLLDFVGKPLKTKTSHIRDTDPASSGDEVTITTIDNFTYDHVGRLLSQTQCIGDETMGGACPNTGDLVDKLLWDGLGPIDSDKEATNSITIKNAVIRPGADGSATTLRIANGSAQELIVFNTYDALGQLAKKKVGGVPGSKYNNTTGLQEVAYKYNVRGWLTQINDPGNTDKLFNFGLSYNDPKNGGTPLFNGNISETAWRTDNDDDSSLKYYSYSYDPLNRITAATDNTQRFGLSNLRYDKNGNITHLTRGGHLKEMPDWDKDDDFGTMDQLDYQYFDGSNRLRSVTDGILKNDTSGKGEFVDGNKDGDDYVYDPNGNMTQDLNKGIKGTTPTEKGIEYNHLNLPTLVRVHNGADVGTISYIYDATGVKLRKNVLKQSETTPTSTDYAGNYVYENGTLQFFSTPEGYATSKNVNDYSAGFDYVYNYVDHLGNVRLSYMHNNGTVEIVKESNYYPFGLQHKGYNNVVNGTEHPYKFGGKEHNQELGLDWYDFGARNYDASLGRWMNPDPLADFAPELTPYRYAANNPIFFNDPNGLWEFVTNDDDDGNITLSLNKTSEDDDWKSLRKETGLSNSQLKKAFGKDFKESLNAVEFGGDGIASSDIGGKVGETVKGIEEGLNELNSALKELNASGAGAVNNCWGACTSISSNNRVNPNGLIGAGFLFDDELQSNFNNVSSARFGDVIRYAQGDDATNTAQHGSMFLLKNDKGSQIFTKNGASNAALYQVMYENEMLKTYSGTGGFANYGQARGMTRTETQTNTVPGSDQTTTSTVKVNDKPYYRPKN